MYNEANFVPVRDPIDAESKLNEGNQGAGVTFQLLDGDLRHCPHRLLTIIPADGNEYLTLLFAPEDSGDVRVTYEVDVPDGPSGFLSFFSATRAVGRTCNGLRYVLSANAGRQSDHS